MYFITPDESPEHILETVTSAVQGGADIVQLRHTTLRRGELLTLARALRRLVADRLLIVNDHLDVAILSEADGVHLGPTDLSIPAARRIAGPGLLIGASAGTRAGAQAAVAWGADYIGCGATFATPIKAEKAVIGPAGVAAVASALEPRVPVFAIGGIDESNLDRLIAVGVRRACVIRAVSEARDPEQAARRLRAMLES